MNNEKKIEDGGPAFPKSGTTACHSLPNGDRIMVDVDPGHCGMSLRDWFLGQALVGLLANHYFNGNISEAIMDADVAADKMVALRNKKTT